MRKRFINKLVPLLALSLVACAQQSYDIKDYVLEMPWKEDFRILQLSDLHIANKDDQQLQFDFIDLTINDPRTSPDLIVMTGDVLTFADRITAKRVFSWMDSHKIPWTMTFGNHDEQCFFSIDWLTGYLNGLSNSSDSYCIFKDIQDDDIMGNANFAINLVDENHKIKSQVIILDSNRYNFGKYQDYDMYIGYDAFHEEQITWYENIVNYTTSLNDGVIVPSYAFFHIPFPEFAEALEYSKTHPESIIIPQNPTSGEPCSCPKINTGMFDKMLELGSTKGVFVGHDHVNNYAINYKGIVLSYGVNSDDRIYYSKDLLGGKVIEIHDDGTFEIEQITHSYGELD